MTTSRSRRTPQARAADILRAELARLMAKTAKSKAAYEQDQAEEARVVKALASLDQLPLPGLNKVGTPGPEPISDVWTEGVTTVHTALMYARQDKCELCRQGVPFASEERTQHYIALKGYEPCEGAIG